MIKIKNLSKIYKKNKLQVKALDKVSLEIEKGDLYGIIGLSGAGKSSLIRCINRLETPTTGEIIFQGEDLLSLSPKKLREKRQKIGMIFQNFNLFSSKTVYENIAFAHRIARKNEDYIKEKVQSLLKRVSLEDKKDMYPANLSGGQKQRVGIARALACDPDVLLCDEATSALDPITTKQILTLLKEIHKETGLTLIVITHEMDVIKSLCNKVAILEQGKIVKSGLTKDLYRHFMTSQKHPNKTRYNSILLKLFFTGHLSEKPILSNLIKSIDVTVNILSGNIEHVQDTLFGELFIELDGNEAAASQAISFLESQNVIVEVIND